MTKNTLFLFVAAALFAGCSQPAVHQCVKPYPAAVQLDSLADCTVPASFTSDDFRWMGGNLTMTVYSEDLYDAVDVSRLQVGDTLVYGGEPIVVLTIANENGSLNINGGLDNGGATLQGYEGGTYRAITFDDHSLYTALGQAQVPLAETFVIIDCGLNPEDPADTIRTDQKLYLETLDGSRRQFTCLDTRVLIENGLITEINRHWIP